MKLETVIFDLDDTLYNEIDYCYSGFAAVAERICQLAGSPSAAKVIGCLKDTFDRGERRMIFNTALDELGLTYDERIIGSLVLSYRNHRPKITLPTDSRQVLEELRKDYRLALITDGFLPAQRLKVEALDIEKYFQVIVYTEELGREFWKPSPVGFENILAALDVRADQVAFVADNEKKDFIAPNQMSMQTIQLQRADRIHREAGPHPDAKASRIIDNIAELPALLKKLQG